MSANVIELSSRRAETRSPSIVETASGLARALGNGGLTFLDRVFDTGEQEHFVYQLEKQKPISEEACAIGALKASKRATDRAIKLAAAKSLLRADYLGEKVDTAIQDAHQMRNIGFGMLKLNLVRADSSEVISDVETSVLVERAVEIGVDPAKQGFVPEKILEPTIKIIEKFDPNN